MERFPGNDKSETPVEYKPMSTEEMLRLSLPADVAEQVIKSGRIAPCAYFTSDILPYGSRMCGKENKAECLTCPDYITVEALQEKEAKNKSVS